MVWKQVIDPPDHLIVSALVAIIPLLVIFWALVIKKMKGYQASLLAILVALLIVLFFYKMPTQLAILSITNGALYGLFLFCWIVIGALFLFNPSVKSGQVEFIQHFMSSISFDRRQRNKHDLPVLPGRTKLVIYCF